MISDTPPPLPAIALAADTPATAVGQFVWREVATASGTRRYRLYIPAGHDGSRTLPLVVMLHGCTQDADNIARGTRMNVAADAKRSSSPIPSSRRRLTRYAVGTGSSPHISNAIWESRPRSPP